ncbi:hypothetical protein MASR1M107_30010 [Ignavibacteriales bacterium]|mgnify:CR=1 FL=1
MKNILLVLFFVIPIASNLAQSIPYKIENIKAFLYYNQGIGQNNSGGTFSENIIDNDQFVLFNTIIGGGSAQGQSNQTMVVVEISGKPKDYQTRILHFKASIRKTVLVDKMEDFASYNDGKYYVAFMLHNVGMGTLKITAEILNGKKIESKLEKKLEFIGGE